MNENSVRGAFSRFLFVLILASLTLRVAPGQRVLREGDAWLKWSHDAREEYVYGFSAGYATGYENACRLMDAVWRDSKEVELENDPLQKCFDKEDPLSRNVDYYSDAVTDFYKRYPDDRDLMIWEVLEQLAKGLTVEHIHHYPFPRKARPQT
jgi:hypothetical protein